MGERLSFEWESCSSASSSMWNWIRSGWLVVLLSAMLSDSVIASAFNPPRPDGHVTDLADVLHSSHEQALETELAAFKRTTGKEIAVLTVESLGELSVEEYAVKVFAAWQLGQKGQDSGVLLLVSPSDRATRIEVGYGLEGDLTDAHSSRIIRNVMIPEFKNGEYGRGILLGVGQILKHLGGKSEISRLADEPDSLTQSADLLFDGLSVVLQILLMLAVSAVIGVFLVVGRKGAWLAGGVAVVLAGGLLQAAIGGNLGWGTLLFLGLLVLVLLGAPVLRVLGRRGRGWPGRFYRALVEISSSSAGTASATVVKRNSSSATSSRTSSGTSSSTSGATRDRQIGGGGGRSGGGGASGHW